MRRTVAMFAVALGCSGHDPRPVQVPIAPRVAGGSGSAVAAPATEPALVPIALVTDPAALAAVTGAGATYAELIDPAGRAVIARAVRDDIATAKRGDPDAGVGIAGHGHRLFDLGWLERGSFELIGLAYRIDRIPVTPASCGDLRLIYRLSYRARTGGVEVGSRLPMTVVIILDGPARAVTTADPLGCSRAAAGWLLPAALAGRALGDAVVAGPLAGALGRDRIRQIETNLQVVRWPSAVRPDLAGHAEYAMRAFRPGAGGLAPSPADNTPDVARLRRDGKARARLLAWLRDPATLDAIELGWAELPAELTAPRGLSVTPRGWARRANRAFRQLLSPAEVADLPLVGRGVISTPEALLRRLDDHTCAGCHEEQTIAGFHLLGEDGPDVAAGNALAVAMSPPLAAEQRRREQLIVALAAGTPVDLHRPSSERTGNPGGRGAHCGLGDPGFAAWTCADGLTCQATDAPRDDAAVGECVASRPEVGDACELGPLTPNADSHRDRGPRLAAAACVDATCNLDRAGFPGGMCRASCDRLPAGGTCGVIAELAPFNACLGRGLPFPRCLADHVSPAGLRACDAATPCRDDYVCARTADGKGACTPPYFLFQLRVDGHPPSKADLRASDTRPPAR